MDIQSHLLPSCFELKERFFGYLKACFFFPSVFVLPKPFPPFANLEGLIFKMEPSLEKRMSREGAFLVPQ